MIVAAHKLPAPPSRESSVPHTSESHHIVRELSFSADTPLLEILAELRMERSTGTLTVNVNQGSVGTITFRAKQKLSVT